MLELAKDILSANTQRKLHFTNELRELTTSVDYKIAKLISSDDILFGQTLVALIRTALLHAKDKTATLNQELEEYFDTKQFSTNFTTILPPFPQASPATSSKDPNQQNIPNPDILHARHENNPDIGNNNNKRVVNKNNKVIKDAPTKTITKNSNQSSESIKVSPHVNTIKTNKVESQSRDQSGSRDDDIINKYSNMDIDSTAVIKEDQHSHHFDEVIHNPWITQDNPISQHVVINNQHNTSTPILDILDLRPNYTFIENAVVNDNDIKNLDAPMPTLIPTEPTNNIKSIDASMHAPPRSRNSRSQTYDARIPIKDIPGDSPAEKISYITNWFLGIESLVNIFVDEIFQEEYYILQFKSLMTMRNLTRKFNRDSGCPAVMTPQKYIKKNYTEASPSPTRFIFKVIDILDCNTLKDTILGKLETIVGPDEIQLIEVQPKQHELHFRVNTKKANDKLRDIWALTIGDHVVRIGPAMYNGQDFLNRNRWIEKSFDAAKFTDAKLLDDLEVIGVKNVYRQPTNSSRVCLAFDSERSYIKAVTTRGLYMGTTKLNLMGITPYFRLDEAKYNKGKKRHQSSEKS